MLLLSFTLLSIVVLLTACFIYHRFRYFSNRSLNSPPLPSIIFGHLSDLWAARSYSEQLRRWTLQCGSLYGIFEGIHPVYVTSDLELIQEIFITQFHRFYGRRTALSNRILGDERLHVFATNSSDQWKRQRTVLNPAFSTLKLKRLLPMIHASIDVLSEKLLLKVNQEINILDFYKRLSMDIICRCIFGLETRIQDDVNNENIYIQKVQEVLEHDFERSVLARIHRVMPCSFLANLCSLAFRLQHLFQNEVASLPANFWLINNMHQFIQARFGQAQPCQPSTSDLLQLMIDAVESDKDRLSSSELRSNCYLMLAAGFETTSTALGYCSYRLAIHQDVQERLYQEIVQNNSADADSYETIAHGLVYLDMFVHEVLRMHPIAIQPVHRQCMESTFIGKHRIEKGTLIQVDVLSVHYNGEYWGPEPVHQFCPERHARKRHPLVFMPFGGGPRTCLGMRFALLEIKLCLARLISKYKILPTNCTERNLNVTEQFVVAPEQVTVKLEQRSVRN